MQKSDLCFALKVIYLAWLFPFHEELCTIMQRTNGYQRISTTQVLHLIKSIIV